MPTFVGYVRMTSRKTICEDTFWIAGNDLNEDTTPIQAGLKWTIGKNRREKCDFLGGDVSFPPFKVPQKNCVCWWKHLKIPGLAERNILCPGCLEDLKITCLLPGNDLYSFLVFQSEILQVLSFSQLAIWIDWCQKANLIFGYFILAIEIIPGSHLGWEIFAISTGVGFKSGLHDPVSFL